MWLVRLLLFIIAVIVLVGFILLNPNERVNVDLYWAEYVQVPLTFVAFIAFAVGMFVSFLYSVFYFIRIAGEIREKNRQIRQLEVELSALRNRSLEDLDEPSREDEEAPVEKEE